MIEEWRDVAGYEGLYQISNLGRVKSLGRYRNNGSGGYIQKESILNPNFKHNRYGKVVLYDGTVGKDRLIHRLVAEAFIPNPSNKPQVNHIDNNSQNNQVDNLEWVTVQENSIHAHKIGASKPPMLGKHHSQVSKDLISKNKIGTPAHNRAFNDTQALQIIKRKLSGEKRISVYKDFKNNITRGGFQNIWYGRSYQKIWKEII